MGQYYKPACPDTGEYLYSHTFGDGLKLMEFSSGTAMVSGIAALLALPSADERGSWTGSSARMGAWAGKRFVVTGDYADEGRFVPPDHQDLNLYSYVSDHGHDISREVMKALGDIAGPLHPMAVRLNKPAGMEAYFYDAPDGMGEYLDLKKARELEFTSFKQLHEFAWQDVELGGEKERLHRFSEVLRLIALKFSTRRQYDVSSLEVKVSEDGMKVERVQFELDGQQQSWSFPLPVATVYKALDILR